MKKRSEKFNINKETVFEIVVSLIFYMFGLLILLVAVKLLCLCLGQKFDWFTTSMIYLASLLGQRSSKKRK